MLNIIFVDKLSSTRYWRDGVGVIKSDGLKINPGAVIMLIHSSLIIIYFDRTIDNRPTINELLKLH